YPAGPGTYPSCYPAGPGTYPSCYPAGPGTYPSCYPAGPGTYPSCYPAGPGTYPSCYPAGPGTYPSCYPAGPAVSALHFSARLRNLSSWMWVPLFQYTIHYFISILVDYCQASQFNVVTHGEYCIVHVFVNESQIVISTETGSLGDQPYWFPI
uniref:Uncharacterized protein n=1 Tax=Callorhinchus milii TaxID=7868 RepID=A0A4W3GBV8_CALMI